MQVKQNKNNISIKTWYFVAAWPNMVLLKITTCFKIVGQNRFLCKRGLNGQSQPNRFLKCRFLYAGFYCFYCIYCILLYLFYCFTVFFRATMRIFVMKHIRHTAPSHTDHFCPQGGLCRVVMVFMNILVSVSCLGISGVHGFHHSFTAKLNFSWSNSLYVVEIQPGFEVSKVNLDSWIL